MAIFSESTRSTQLGRHQRGKNKPKPSSWLAQPARLSGDQLSSVRMLRGAALAGAMAISKKAAKAGFEWDDMDGVWDKVHEELSDLKASGCQWRSEPRPGGTGRCAEHCVVNVARWCAIEPEEGLAGTNQRQSWIVSRNVLLQALEGEPSRPQHR